MRRGDDGCGANKKAHRGGGDVAAASAREQYVQFLTLTLKFQALNIENSQNPSPTKVPKEEAPNPPVKVSNLNTLLL